jgi:hypothetical protein
MKTMSYGGRCLEAERFGELQLRDRNEIAFVNKSSPLLQAARA